MMALGITFFVILQYFMPAPSQTPQVAPDPTHQQQEVVVAAPAALPSAAPAAIEDFNPETEYEISVRIGDSTPGGNGYEARFSTAGASMSSYRLLGFARRPALERVPGDEVILLERLAAGRDTFRVDAATFGASGQELQTVAMGTFNFELREIPTWAEITPPVDGSVTRGDKLVFRAVVGEWEVLKTFTFPRDDSSRPYSIDMDLAWRNLASSNRLLLYRLAGPTGMLADDDTSNFGIINFITAR